MEQNKQTPCESSDLRIIRVDVTTHEEINNIADYYGVSLSDFLKKQFKKIVDDTPEHIKDAKRECDPCKEVRVTGMRAKTKEELENIAAYYETKDPDFLRSKLVEIKNSFPEHIRKWKKDAA